MASSIIASLLLYLADCVTVTSTEGACPELDRHGTKKLDLQVSCRRSSKLHVNLQSGKELSCRAWLVGVPSGIRLADSAVWSA